MEKRYFEPGQERFVSPPVDFENYFNEFGKLVAATFPEPGRKSGLSQLSGLSADEVKAMESRTKRLFPRVTKDSDFLVPKLGFRQDFHDDPPKEAIASLRCLSSAGSCSSSKLRYSGEVNLEDLLCEEKEKFESRIDLTPYGFFVATLRVYLPVRHSKYVVLTRAKYLQVSQELLCLSSTGLDVLRDRIACTADLQPIDGDISDDVRRPLTRAGDSHRSALFYIGNDFFIDSRHTDNIDYSVPIVKWGVSEGFEFGERHLMERSLFTDLKAVRLGYPYLYLHQGHCEHLLVFTDVRLLSPRDPFDSTKYPFLSSFANLKGRYCFACHLRAARYIIVGNDRLPEEVAFMCTTCLESYNYHNKRKVGRFKVYGYVDRTAML